MTKPGRKHRERGIMNSELKMEVNAKFAPTDGPIVAGNTVVMVTPPLDEDYWLARVPVSDKQAIVCFPKFGTIGIGFQHEDEDWNTNLPYSCDAVEIYDHIKENRRGAAKAKCVAAIKMVSEYAKSLKS